VDATQRRERIAERLAKDGQTSVAELSRAFGVSEVTIRADLRTLAAARLLRRTRGGAVAVRPAEPQTLTRQGLSADRPGTPAIAAADLVQPGDTVVIESSVDVASALGGRTPEITVCTASLDVAGVLRGTGITVVLAGGTLDPATGLIGPPQAGPMWDQVTADLAILGCDGVSATGGVTVADAARAWVWRRCAAMAGRRILIAGTAAVGSVAAHVLSDVREIDLCLVPSTVDSRRVSALRRAGLTVLRTQ
jgi:DeoR family transcriptional regulator, aga operon transcriptional repressor